MEKGSACLFDHHQNANFKNRFHFWMAQGCTDEVARHRANLEALLLSLPESDDLQEDDQKSSAQVVSIASRSKQVSTETKKVPKLQSISKIASKVDAQNPIGIRALTILFNVMVVSGCISFLTYSTAQSFGNGWQGWVKAIVLEFGIVGLTLIKPNDALKLLGARFLATSLIILSLIALHTGVKNQENSATNSVLSEDASLKSLREQREGFSIALKNLPESHVARRLQIIDQIKKTDQEMHAAKEIALSGTGIDIIQLISFQESLIRLAMMLINIVFVHLLVEQIRRGQQVSLCRV